MPTIIPTIIDNATAPIGINLDKNNPFSIGNKILQQAGLTPSNRIISVEIINITKKGYSLREVRKEYNLSNSDFKNAKQVSLSTVRWNNGKPGFLEKVNTINLSILPDKAYMYNNEIYY